VELREFVEILTILVTSLRLKGRSFNPHELIFLVTPFQDFTHYLDMQLPTHPRRSDCPGRFLSAEPRRTSCTSSKAMYNQPNSFYASKVLEDMLPLAGCNSLRIVKVRTVSAVWRFRPMSTFHSQGIRQLCGKYIVAHKAVLEGRGFQPKSSIKLKSFSCKVFES